MTFFDFMDKFSANFLLPIGALFIVIFVAWKMGKDSFYDEITNQNTLKISVKKFIYFIIKFVAPIVIVAIFINQLIG
jgi:NSS family neurotransmitter:Na+ symporter